MIRPVKMIMFYYMSILFFIFDSGIFHDGPIGVNVGYLRLEAFDDLVCLPENVVFDVEGVTSVSKCALLCSTTRLCFGIFYRPEEGTCTGCTYFFNSTTLAQAGEMYYRRRVYVVIGEELTWTEAKEKCIALGGLLASINSLLEQQLIDQFIDEQGYGDVSRVWIGGNDMATEEIYLWEDGTAFLNTSFSNWEPGQPNNKKIKIVLI